MSERMRVLATGELQTGELCLGFVPLDSYELLAWHYDLDEAREEAVRLAMAHGAVLFEINDVEPDTGGPALGWLDQEEAKPQDDWVPRIVLRVDSPCVRLRTPTLDRVLLAQRWQAGEQANATFFVALMPAAELDLDEQASIQLAYIRALLPTGDGQPPIWQLGDEGSLQPYLCPPAAQRDWDWPWRQHTTIGPVYLWIAVDRTAEQLAAWLASVVPHGLLPVEPYEYRFDPALEDFDGRLLFTDGLITFMRSYHSPGDVAQLIDAALLASIASGALGEVSWDLLDGDYIYYEATGEGLASLREYLDPGSDEDQLRSRWRSVLAGQAVDARAAESWRQVAELMLQHFQVDAALPDPRDALEQWLRTAPIAALPRRIDIKLCREVYDTYQTDPFYARMIGFNRRIVWSIGC